MKKYEILESLPTYGKMYIPISQDEENFYSEGFVVRFFKDDGSDWVANFKSIYGLNKVIECSNNLIVVIAGGLGYVINPNYEKALGYFGEGLIHNIFETETEELICVNDTQIEVFNPKNSKVWTSKRISWDGFDDLTFENGILKGKALNPFIGYDDEWVDFSFNLKTKEIEGGSYK